MKHPRQTKDEILRVDLDGGDVETIELLLDRLDILVQIEDLMDSRASHSPFIMGNDLNHITQAARHLLADIIDPWTIKPGKHGDWVVEEV